MQKFISLVLVLLWCLTACDKSSVEFKPGFYHWKSIAQHNPEQINYLNNLGVDYLHYRFFDLSNEQGTIKPVGIANPDSSLLAQRDFAACIFITNSCFLKIEAEETNALATKILDKLSRQLEKANVKEGWKELQIDCDWTAKSKEAYFTFLKQLQEKLPDDILLSATIRLHQVRYPNKTGIPPVDKGALMCYNMGDIQNIDETNSIYNSETLASYLPKDIKYPLELDIALPLFEWYLVYRDGKLHRIISDQTPEIFSQDKTLKNHRLEKDQYLSGHYLYKDDYIRKEAVDISDLEDALNIINETKLKTSEYLLFYHLNETVTKKFPHAKLEALCAGKQ